MRLTKRTGARCYPAQPVLIPRHSLAREFNRSEISKFAPVVGEPPKDETYQRLLTGGFAEWRLTVDGAVARPCSFFPAARSPIMFASKAGPSLPIGSECRFPIF